LALMENAEQDLRAPLLAIRQAVSWLEGCLARGMPGLTAEQIDFVVGAAERLESTTDGLIAYGHLTSVEPAIAQVDLKAIADVAVMLTRTRFPAVDVGFVLGPMPTVLGDPDLLLRALLELLANAVEFRRCHDAAIVTMTASVANGRAVVRVADQGMGIDPRHHEEIFQPLSRLHPYNEHRGAGMGLAVARAVATAHDGALFLESSNADGSVFTLSWPQVIALV